MAYSGDIYGAYQQGAAVEGESQWSALLDALWLNWSKGGDKASLALGEALALIREEYEFAYPIDALVWIDERSRNPEALAALLAEIAKDHKTSLLALDFWDVVFLVAAPLVLPLVAFCVGGVVITGIPMLINLLKGGSVAAATAAATSGRASSGDIAGTSTTWTQTKNWQTGEVEWTPVKVSEFAKGLTWRSLFSTALTGAAFYSGASGTFRLMDLALSKLGIFTQPEMEADLNSAWFKIYQGAISEGYSALEAYQIAKNITGYTPKYLPSELSGFVTPEDLEVKTPQQLAQEKWAYEQEYRRLSGYEEETPESRAQEKYLYEQEYSELSGLPLPYKPTGELPYFYGEYSDWVSLPDYDKMWYAGYGGELPVESEFTLDDLQEFFNLQTSTNIDDFDLGEGAWLVGGKVVDNPMLKWVDEYGEESEFEYTGDSELSIPDYDGY